MQHTRASADNPFYLNLLTYTCWLLLFSLWLVPIIEFKNLPEIIPSHFNARGEVDRYSSKAIIFLLPAIGTFTIFVLLLVGKSSNRFAKSYLGSYQVALSPDSEVRMLHVMAVLAGLLFLLIEMFTLFSAKTGKSPEHFYLVFVISGCMVVYPFIEMLADRKRRK